MTGITQGTTDQSHIPNVLEDTPIEVFCKFALKLPITEILKLSALSKTIKAKTNSDTLWVQLLERDFGDIERVAYHKQRTSVSGKHTAKEYYKFLLNSFDSKASDFIKFSVEYKNTYPWYFINTKEIKDIIVKIELIIPDMHRWLSLESQFKIDTISDYNKGYNVVINYLALNSMPHIYGCPPPYLHDNSPLLISIKKSLTLTAISLIKSPHIQLKEFVYGNTVFSPLFKAALHGDSDAVKEIITKNDHDLFSECGRTLFLFKIPLENNIKMQVFYHLLKSCTEQCSKILMPIILYKNIMKADIYDYIISLAQDRVNLEEKISIFQNSIAIVDGHYNSSLSYYLHEVKSPCDYVKKIEDLINEIKRNAKVELTTSIEKPKIELSIIESWPVDELRSVWRNKRPDSYVEDISEREFEDDRHKKRQDRMNAQPQPGIQDCKSQTSNNQQPCQDDLSQLPTTITIQRDEGYIRSQERQKADLMIEDMLKRHRIAELKLETVVLAIVSIGVGLAFGFGLGMGAHAHIAISVLSAIVSSLSSFALSLRYIYSKAMKPAEELTYTQKPYRPFPPIHSVQHNNAPCVETVHALQNESMAGVPLITTNRLV